MSVIDWLLESYPSIRWQVMRDRRMRSGRRAAERAKVAVEGWGARLLSLQAPDGKWGGGAALPGWTSTNHTLWLLRVMGIDPANPGVRRAIALVRERVRWEYDENMRFFDGEVEPCINGTAVVIGSYFGEDVGGIVQRLLGEQMADGGWNCEQERGSTRGSFDTTIRVLEGLLGHESATGGSPAVRAARERASILLERRCCAVCRRRVDRPADTQLSFPPDGTTTSFAGSTTSTAGLSLTTGRGASECRKERSPALAGPWRRRRGRYHSRWRGEAPRAETLNAWRAQMAAA